MVVSKWFGIGEWWWLMVDARAWFIYFNFFMIFHNIPWLVWCQLVYVWSRKQLGQQIWINKNISNSTTHWQFHHRSTFVSNDRDHVTRLAFSVQDVSDLLNVLEAGGFESDPDFANSPNKKRYWYPLIIWNGWLEVDDLIVGPFWWSCLRISAVSNLRNMWRVGPFSLAWGTWDPDLESEHDVGPDGGNRCLLLKASYIL